MSFNRVAKKLTTPFTQFKPTGAILMINMSDPQKLADCKKAVSDLIKIFKSELLFRFQYVKNLTENPREILEIWLWYARKILLAEINNKKNKELEDSRAAKIKKFLEVLQETIFLLERTNVNQKLALENLMLSL